MGRPFQGRQQKRNKKKTFKPVKEHKTGSKHDKLSKMAQYSLGSGDIKSAVVQPKDTTKNEWIAINVIDFYNDISLLYGAIADFCTEKACPVMSAGQQFTYLWADSKGSGKPRSVSAPEYVELLMEWIESTVEDSAIFPAEPTAHFPTNFMSIAQNIFKKLFRVYAHIYHHHFEQILNVGAEAHLNTCFKHFMLFVDEFRLIQEKDLAPLQELITKRLAEEAKETK